MSSLNDRIDELVGVCKEVKLYASEMASELTIDAGSVLDRFQSALESLASSSNEEAKAIEGLRDVAEGVESLVAKAAALGGMMGLLQDVYEPLEEISARLKQSDFNLVDPSEGVANGHFATMLYKSHDAQDWVAISFNALRQMPILEFSEILLTKDHLFLNGRGQLQKSAACLLELGRERRLVIDSDGSANFRILVVDDDELVQGMLKRNLKKTVSNAEVCSAYSVEQALASLDSSLDVIFLDIHLPDGSGLQVLDSVRSSPVLRPLPVFIMTADPSPDLKKKAQDLVVSGFLDKKEVGNAMRLLAHMAKMYRDLKDQSSHSDQVYD